MALETLLQEGEGALTKLMAGLKDTLCRFLMAPAEASMGVPTVEGDTLLAGLGAPLRTLTDCGLRLEACSLGLLGSSWRRGVPSLAKHTFRIGDNFKI